MASTFDAIGPSSAGHDGGTPSPNTWSHVVTGTNNTLIVFASLDNVALSIPVTCTFGGTSMTEIGRLESGNIGAGVGFAIAFKLLSVAAGSNTVSLAWTTGSSILVTAGSLSATGAGDVGTAVMTANNGGGGGVSSGTVTVPSTTSGNLVVAGITSGSDNVAGTTGTLRWTTATSGSGAAGASAAMSTVSAGGNATIAWTQATDWNAYIAFEITAAGGVTPTPQPPIIVNKEAIRRSYFW